MRELVARRVLFGLGWSAIALASCSVYDSSLLPQGESTGSAASATGGALGSGGTSAAGNAPSGGAAASGSGGTGGGADTGGAAGMAEIAGEGGQSCTGGDCCPSDPNKTEPGVCGCGVADTDTDGDGTPDCVDQCPADPNKIAPEVCGCGVAEAPCLALQSSLLHRYSFSGTGTIVTDSKSAANGAVMGKGAALSGNGTLVLAGGVLPVANDPGQYVELPTNCLMGLSNATFEAWVTWNGGTDSATYRSYWQRIFDFGETSTTTSGTYLLLTPRAASAAGPSRVAFTAGMGAMSEAPVVNGVPLSAGATHFTVVVDQTNSLISLYLNGTLSAAGTFTSSLSAINASNCWLGRSQYAADPYFSGTFDEFRVYSAALSAADIAFSQSMGPNPTFL